MQCVTIQCVLTLAAPPPPPPWPALHPIVDLCAADGLDQHCSGVQLRWETVTQIELPFPPVMAPKIADFSGDGHNDVILICRQGSVCVCVCVCVCVHVEL